MHKMANPNSTHTKPLPSYIRLSNPERLAVEMRANGRAYEDIIAAMNHYFGFERSYEAVRDWFRPGIGRLTQALDQYRDIMLRESMRETLMMEMRASVPAVVTLVKLLEHPKANIQLKAAIALLELAFPYGMDGPAISLPKEFELPSELDDGSEEDEELNRILDDINAAKARIAERQIKKVPAMQGAES